MHLLHNFWPQLARTTSSAPSQTFFYEVVPSAQIEVPRVPGATYAAKERLARQALDEIVPQILSVLGLEAPKIEPTIGAGGYERMTNPSIQTYVDIDDPTSRVLAAALGWIFRQKSVLVADLQDEIEQLLTHHETTHFRKERSLKHST